MSSGLVQLLCSKTILVQPIAALQEAQAVGKVCRSTSGLVCFAKSVALSKITIPKKTNSVTSRQNPQPLAAFNPLLGWPASAGLTGETICFSPSASKTWS
jgi:hypothetical protein